MKRHPSVDCHLFERIMNDELHPEMGYRGVLWRLVFECPEFPRLDDIWF